MKRFLKTGLVLTIVLSVLLSFGCLTALAYGPSDIAGSWYGQYTGHTNSTAVERYIDLTIDSCDDSGNFTGSAKVTTVEGQGYDYQWVNYDFSGKADFDTGSFTMQGTRITAHNSSTSNWTMIPFDGSLSTNVNGDVSIVGWVSQNGQRPFLINRISQWARDEMTEANILGLIPDTLKDADMSKRISRAEFAAVSVKLYEMLSGKTASTGSMPFTDVAGNANLTEINKAYQLGIAVGISDTQFAPDDSITREQLATMLCRTIKKYRFADWTFATDAEYHMDTDGAKKFADDGDISDFAKESVYYMAKMGIISGVDDTHFAPRNVTPAQEAQGYATATREQAIALSLRIYKLADLWN